MKYVISESQLKRLNESVKTPCQTPDAKFNISIKDRVITCEIELPFDLEIDESEAKILESNIHNSFEIILSKYWD